MTMHSCVSDYRQLWGVLDTNIYVMKFVNIFHFFWQASDFLKGTFIDLLLTAMI